MESFSEFDLGRIRHLVVLPVALIDLDHWLTRGSLLRQSVPIQWRWYETPRCH